METPEIKNAAPRRARLNATRTQNGRHPPQTPESFVEPDAQSNSQGHLGHLDLIGPDRPAPSAAFTPSAPVPQASATVPTPPSGGRASQVATKRGDERPAGNDGNGVAAGRHPMPPEVSQPALFEPIDFTMHFDPLAPDNVRGTRDLLHRLEHDPMFAQTCRDIYQAWQALVSRDTWKAAIASGGAMSVAHAAEIALLFYFSTNPFLRMAAVTYPYAFMGFIQTFVKRQLDYQDPDPQNKAPHSLHYRTINSVINWNVAQPWVDRMFAGNPFLYIMKTAMSGGLQGIKTVLEHIDTSIKLGRLPTDAPPGPQKLDDLGMAVAESLQIALRNPFDIMRQSLKTLPAQELARIAKQPGVAALLHPKYAGAVPAMNAVIVAEMRKSMGRQGEADTAGDAAGFGGLDPYRYDPFNSFEG